MAHVPHDISGLIDWARRPEWRAEVAAFLDHHTATACAEAGIQLAGVADLMGDYVVTTLWGAAFEDLLATDLSEGRNLADEYLRRRGWKESVATREYISGLRRTAISLYDVSGVVPGRSMLLRDLVRGDEPVQVQEKRGSEELRQWDRIATRVIPLRSHSVISGTLMHFEHEASETLLASLRKVISRAPPAAAEAARAVCITVSDAEAANVNTPDLTLGQAAFMISNTWLASGLRQAQGRNRPELVNSDGDPLEFTTVHFPLLRETILQQVRQVLAHIPGLRQENANFWNWLGEQRQPARLTRSQSRKAQTFTTTMDDGSLVLGTVELKGRRLSLSANSSRRAEHGRVLLEQALAGLVDRPLVEHADIDQLLTAKTPVRREETKLPPNEERAIVHETLDAHYRRILNEPIPALGGKSPLAAARTAKGRDKVVAWLKTLENHMAREPRGSPMATYDLSWIWRELGVEALRR